MSKEMPRWDEHLLDHDRKTRKTFSETRAGLAGEGTGRNECRCRQCSNAPSRHSFQAWLLPRMCALSGPGICSASAEQDRPTVESAELAPNFDQTSGNPDRPPRLQTMATPEGGQMQFLSRAAHASGVRQGYGNTSKCWLSRVVFNSCEMLARSITEARRQCFSDYGRSEIA